MLNVDDLLVVEENLSTVETQLNETNARAGAAPGVFKAEQYGVSSANNLMWMSYAYLLHILTIWCLL